MRSLAAAALLASVALLSGCDQSGFAKELLEKDGYTDVDVKKDGDHHYAFTAKNKQGQKCTGSMELRGNPQSHTTSTTATCGP
jgi:glutaredoxin